MVGSIVCNAGSREGRERGETVVCTSGTSEAIDRQETVMDIGGIGIIPSIAAAMMDCAGIGLVVNRIEPTAEIASIGSNSSVITLTVHCIVSTDVVNSMEAIVDTASVGCTSSGVALIVYWAGSTGIVHGVNSTVLVTFTGIVPLTIVSNGSGESTKGAQVTVESIISSGGGERILVDWVTAERCSLNSVVALVVGYIEASEDIEVVAGSISVETEAVQNFSFFFSLTLAQLQNPACELVGASSSPSLRKGVWDLVALQPKGGKDLKKGGQ